MLESKVSILPLFNENNIYTSNSNLDFRVLPYENSAYKNYSKTFLSYEKRKQFTSNTLSITDVALIHKANKRKLENLFANEFDIFKEKFENFLRFEDIPIEYVSPIEKEFIKFLKNEKVQTLNLVGQWIIDSYNDTKTLLNIVKILGNVAHDFLSGQFLTNLFILLNHKDTEIKEYVLRIQEKVMSEVFHNLLSHSHLAPQWIDEYRIELVDLFNEDHNGMR